MWDSKFEKMNRKDESESGNAMTGLAMGTGVEWGAPFYFGAGEMELLIQARRDDHRHDSV